MSDDTIRLKMPLLAAGQAQKEITHNEALTVLDLAVHAAVSGVGVTTPPATPALGAAWIVGDVPTGAWAGQALALAGWTAGGWRFVAPTEGMTVWHLADRRTLRHVAGAWVGGVGVPAAAIPEPLGGSVIDAETRSAVAAILRMLRQHGLITV